MAELFAPMPCYVVLHIGTGPSQGEVSKRARLVVTDDRKRFDLTDDIWIERLDKELAANIQKACEPANYKVETTVNDRHLYAFMRRVPDTESRKYEGVDDLLATIALSRLIHPTTTGDRYLARILAYGVANSSIQAIPLVGMSLDVNVSGREPDWLSEQDGENLRKLMPWLSKNMHSRVHQAYWHHEYAMRSFYMDMRWTLVVSGLEALISVGENDLNYQFQMRGELLGTKLGVSLTQADLKKAYKLRSKLVHAEKFLHELTLILPESEHRDLYDRLEILLRSAVRRSMEEEAFGNTFRDDGAVQSAWSIPSNPNKKRKKNRK